jgi:hypothetical protein
MWLLINDLLRIKRRNGRGRRLKIEERRRN